MMKPSLDNPARVERLTRVAWQPWAWSAYFLLLRACQNRISGISCRTGLTRRTAAQLCGWSNRLGSTLSGPVALERLSACDVALTYFGRRFSDKAPPKEGYEEGLQHA